MDRRSLAVFGAAAIFLAGCSLFRWSGYAGRDPARVGEWSATELIISTEPAKVRPALPVRLEEVAKTLYYSDLGPDTIDVADYPTQQQYNYALFSRQCARCHTLARAINSPVQSRAYWRFHLARMSLHSRVNREGSIPPEKLGFILDFLEYDSNIRKVQHKKEFEELTQELKRRFDPTLKKLVEQTR